MAATIFDDVGWSPLVALRVVLDVSCETRINKLCSTLWVEQYCIESSNCIVRSSII